MSDIRIPSQLAELLTAEMAEQANWAPVPIPDWHPRNDATLRDDAEALMPEEVYSDFLKGLTNQAAALNTFTRIPVSRQQSRIPILSTLPFAFWVNGDTGLKATTKAAWKNKYLNVEDLAVIIPIPENVLDDADMPIWDQVRPLCEQAAARVLDDAVFFGTNAPASFPDDVVTAATAAGNTATIGTSTDADGGIVGDHSTMLGTLEDSGFDPSAGISSVSIRGLARQARNANGDRFGEVKVNQDSVEIDSVTYTHPMRGLWPSASGTTQAIAFDTTQFVVGVRSDITWKLLDQAVITNELGEIVFNLPQQDMVAMRMVMRVGWQVANTITYDQQTEANRYPAALLKKA